MRTRMLTRSAILSIVLLAGAAAIARVDSADARVRSAALEALPMDIGSWRGRDGPPFDADTLAVLGVDDLVTRVYADARTAVDVYVGYWGAQRQGDTMHSPLNCLPGSGWEPVSKRALRLRVRDGDGASREIAINRYLVERYGDRELVLYWYQQHGRVVASEYVTRLFQIADAIRLHRTDGAIVRLMIPAGSEETAERSAETNGIRFATALYPWLDRALPS